MNLWTLALVSALSCAPQHPPPGQDPDAGSAVSSSSMAGEIVRLTNVERARAGLRPLRANKKLMRAAQLHAEQMARFGKMEHVIRGARYPAPGDRIAAVGYNWQAYAENVAFGALSAAGTVGSWMHSPGHRANILRDTYTEIGVGYALDAAGRAYYVQVFGRPRH